MRSPFPGMDPYLERHWLDVHSTFMVYAKQQLNRQLPAELLARVEEGVSVETDDSAPRMVYPDVRVTEVPESAVAVRTAPVEVAVAEPFEVPVASELPPQRHLEIIDSGSGNRVVTVIELLSPANKIGQAGRAAYRRKQADYIRGLVNLVEIDLIRSGSFILAMPEEDWPERHQATYKICIRRVQRAAVAAGIGVSLREPLPNIAIPLRPTDRDVVLQLQPIFDDIYRDGRYQVIDYNRPCRPPLDEEDARWTAELLKSRESP